MDTDLKTQNLLKSKNEILDKILNNLITWDGELETGIGLIESNQEYLDELKEINKELSLSEITSTYDKEYENKLHLIIKEQNILTTSLKVKQDNILKDIKQLSKKDKVINNYLSMDREPIFINKQLF